MQVRSVLKWLTLKGVANYTVAALLLIQIATVGHFEGFDGRTTALAFIAGANFGMGLYTMLLDGARLTYERLSKFYHHQLKPHGHEISGVLMPGESIQINLGPDGVSVEKSKPKVH